MQTDTVITRRMHTWMIGRLKNVCLLSWLETFKDAVTTSNTMPQNSHSHTLSITACAGRQRLLK